ncbi:sialidase family protein [Fodinibius salsisoli]|uniref:Exo-alpha-sialidase n=1 Tax=Fodinibius salsisoli TaxID=2820877 RepID=A0ABT3PJV0_9BACT|nr:sialidase family protein [Fodinibius salsisoli]MCW9706182.1 exo-alpha-sialidase [Fodinibius salsisoli]
MSKPTIYLFFGLFFLIFAGCQKTEHKFSHTDNPAGPGSKYPHLASSGDTLYMSWMETNTDSNHTYLLYASYTNGQWSPAETIAQSSSWFVNWADYPSVIVDTHGPVAAHWLNKKTGGTYAYDVSIAFRNPQSPKWSSSLTPHADSTATEHGFVSMIPWDYDSILAVWLDGRRSAQRDEDEYYDLSKAMTLRGALISTSGSVEKRFLIDDSVCDCCQTALVKTAGGALVAYRNRTGDEIRDIYFSRFNGESWSKGVAVHNDGWKIGACPVNGPVLAARDSLVAIAWPTSANKQPKVKAALSTDGGSSFSQPVSINNEKSAGRVDIALDGDRAYVSWLAEGDHLGALNLRTIDKNLKPSIIFTADSINASRKSGFPQLEILNDNIILGWTDITDSTSSIKMIRKRLPLLPD